MEEGFTGRYCEEDSTREGEAEGWGWGLGGYLSWLVALLFNSNYIVLLFYVRGRWRDETGGVGRVGGGEGRGDERREKGEIMKEGPRMVQTGPLLSFPLLSSPSPPLYW